MLRMIYLPLWRLLKWPLLIAGCQIILACGADNSKADTNPEPVPDTIPEIFRFENQTAAAVGLQVLSNSIIVTGINAASPISIDGGEYSIDGGEFTPNAGQVSNGQSVQVRMTSPETLNSTAVVTLTIGGVSGEFSVTTITDIGAKWVGTWANSVYEITDSNDPPTDLSNNTLRQVVRVSAGGNRIRLKFSNRLGNSPLVMNSVRLAESTGGSAIDIGTSTIIKFNGSESVAIPAGESVTSDTLLYNLSALSRMAISIYFGDVPSTLSGHPGSRTTSYIQSGDATSASSLSSATTTDRWYIIEGIDVFLGESARAVIGFGDSITDGRGTTTNEQNRWTDVLATRLQNNTATANQVGVLNAGIGGTLAAGSGLNRFDRDVLSLAGGRYVIILYGVNDIVYASADASRLINAYGDYISSAHSEGMRVYGGTLLPFGGSGSYTAAREQVRQQVNDWIRSTSPAEGGFDAVIDFDAALRDPDDPTRLMSLYDSGDHLHPGPEGYQRMGDIIELNLLTD